MSDEKLKPRREREFDGPIWKHPYFAYVWISMILFIGLVVAAWLAIRNGWLPNTGT